VCWLVEHKKKRLVCLKARKLGGNWEVEEDVGVSWGWS
jgi:hypothetical protein